MPTVLLRTSILLIGALVLVASLGVVGHSSATASLNGFDMTGFVGPSGTQTPSYQASPGVPPNFRIAANTTVAYLTDAGPGNWGIANATAGYASQPFVCAFGLSCGGQAYSSPQIVYPFSPRLSALSDDNVPCTGSYRTTFALAVSILSLTSSTTVQVDAQTDDGVEVYFAPTSAVVWTNIMGGAAWKGQGETDYPGSISLASGAYYVVIEWFNNCGPGILAVQFDGLPVGSTFTPSAYLSPQPPVHRTINDCEAGFECSTAAVLFSSSGKAGGATVTLSSIRGPILVAQTNSVALRTGLCALPVNTTLFGCLQGETGQFVVNTGQTYLYTVVYADGARSNGTFLVSAPWTVRIIRVA